MSSWRQARPLEQRPIVVHPEYVVPVARPVFVEVPPPIIVHSPPPPPPPMPVFTGKRIVITGADANTGSMITSFPHVRGHKFFLTGDDAEKLAEACAAAEVRGAFGAAFEVADISREQEVDRCFALAMDFLGGVDVFVSAAAWNGDDQKQQQSPISAFDRTFDITVRGMYMWTSRVVSQMGSTTSGPHGQVVFVCSGKVLPFKAAGCGAQWAVQGIAMSLRKELEADGCPIKVGIINSCCCIADRTLQQEEAAGAVWRLIDQPPMSNIEHLTVE